MKLHQVIIEKKIITVKATTYPKNALVARAVDDLDGEVSDLMRQKLRNMITMVKRNGRELWTLDASKLNNRVYKLIIV